MAGFVILFCITIRRNILLKNMVIAYEPFIQKNNFANLKSEYIFIFRNDITPWELCEYFSEKIVLKFCFEEVYNLVNIQTLESLVLTIYSHITILLKHTEGYYRRINVLKDTFKHPKR